MRGRSVLKVSAQALGARCVPHGLMMASFEAWVRSRSVRAFGFTWMRWLVEGRTWVHADNVSNEAVRVIGLHGSGDKLSLFLQDWELAKVALSCHVALDILCQEMYEVERRRGWFGF